MYWWMICEPCPEDYHDRNKQRTQCDHTGFAKESDIPYQTEHDQYRNWDSNTFSQRELFEHWIQIISNENDKCCRYPQLIRNDTDIGKISTCSSLLIVFWVKKLESLWNFFWICMVEKWFEKGIFMFLKWRKQIRKNGVQ